MSLKREIGNNVQTISELVSLRAAEQLDVPFLISPETGRQLTFRGLQEQSRQLYARFLQIGLERGDKIAFLMDNGLFTAQLFLAAIANGFVAVPLNVRAGVSQLSYTLDHSDAKVVYLEPQYESLLKEVLAVVPRKLHVETVGVDHFPDNMPAATAEPPATAATDVALLMYTSGSTGMPKAAVHTQGSILAQARNSVLSHELTHKDRSLLVLRCITSMPSASPWSRRCSARARWSFRTNFPLRSSGTGSMNTASLGRRWCRRSFRSFWTGRTPSSGSARSRSTASASCVRPRRRFRPHCIASSSRSSSCRSSRRWAARGRQRFLQSVPARREQDRLARPAMGFRDPHRQPRRPGPAPERARRSLPARTGHDHRLL